MIIHIFQKSVGKLFTKKAAQNIFFYFENALYSRVNLNFLFSTHKTHQNKSILWVSHVSTVLFRRASYRGLKIRVFSILFYFFDYVSHTEIVWKELYWLKMRVLVLTWLWLDPKLNTFFLTWLDCWLNSIENINGVKTLF